MVGALRKSTASVCEAVVGVDIDCCSHILAPRRDAVTATERLSRLELRVSVSVRYNDAENREIGLDTSLLIHSTYIHIIFLLPPSRYFLLSSLNYRFHFNFFLLSLCFTLLHYFSPFPSYFLSSLPSFNFKLLFPFTFLHLFLHFSICS